MAKSSLKATPMQRLWILLLICVLLPTITASTIYQPPQPLPIAEIQIISPGPKSRVTSPLVLRVMLKCGANGLTSIDLMDKKSNLLSRHLLRLDCASGELADLSIPIYFDAPMEGIQGRLSVATQDQHARDLALASIEVTLSQQIVDIKPPEDENAVFVITSPEPDSTIVGGEATVTGWIRPKNTNPIIFELITDTGSVIGIRQLLIPDDFADPYFPFDITLSYITLSRTRDVRLTLRQRDTNITGTLWLGSMHLWADP